MATDDLLAYGPALNEAAIAGDGEDELALVARLDDALSLPDALRDEVRVVTRFGDIATLRVRRRALASLAALPEIVGLETARQMFDPNLDADVCESDFEAPARARDYTRRPAGVAETGRRVVVGVLDWGLDIAYPSFRHADGSTRLLGFWDQRAGLAGRDNRWGYGRQFSPAEINRALRTQRPYAMLDYHPGDADSPSGSVGWQGSHGVHVLDIAAGNGRGGGVCGVAPEADLVFVHLARTADIQGRENLGDSVSVLEAIDYVFSVAGDRPCVINMSVGAHGGPHDGTTCVEAGIDRAVWLRDNRAIVNSAGNYFGARAHAQGRLQTGGVHTLELQVPAGDPTSSELEIYYQRSDRFLLEVIDPSGRQLARVALGHQAELTLGGRPVGRVYHLARNNGNFDRLIDIFFYPDAPGGRWHIRVLAERVDDGRFHAWIERDRGPRPYFSHAQSRGASTTGTLCNGMYSITVGAHDPYRPGAPIGSFSSAGPTRDGRIKPELTAPGARILAAQSAPPGDTTGGAARLTRKTGTSMAAPHVAGAVALMFEAAQAPLPISELRALLFSSLTPRSPRFAEPESIHRYGFGALDIDAAVCAARRWRRQMDVGPQASVTETVAPAHTAESVLLDIASVVFRHALGNAVPAPEGWQAVDPQQAQIRAGDVWLRNRPGEGLRSVALVTAVSPTAVVDLIEVAHPNAPPRSLQRALPRRWRDTLLRRCAVDLSTKERERIAS